MRRWTALVPVKPWGRAKSRLDLPTRARRTLARAFTLDLLDILSRTPEIARILLITDEHEVLAPARMHGATVLSDNASHSSDQLNVAIGRGRIWAAIHHGSDRLVVIPADLPCLTSEDLSMALAKLGQQQRAYVPDANGSGTTLLAAATPRALTSAYGRDSAARHRGLGLVPVVDVAECIRHDVDTLTSLVTAQKLGIPGRRTRSALPLLEELIPMDERNDAAAPLRRIGNVG